MSVEAVQVSWICAGVAVPLTLVGAVGACVSGAGALLTVTPTPADVVGRDDVSVATAVTVCGPSPTVRLSQDSEYGEDVSGLPTFVPSTLNWTEATPRLSAAVAVSETVAPQTVAPAAGAVTETVGGVVSGTIVADSSREEAPALPAASAATTW